MRILTFLLFFISLAGQAQSAITGIVKDSETQEILPFATIYQQNGKSIIADLDGKFVLEHAKMHEIFTVAYIGYQQRSFKITPGRIFYSVALEAKPEQLNELVINNENPVIGIIKRAIRGRIINDPQQKLSSFSYKTYERLIVTANPDSINGTLDSIYSYEKAGRIFKKIDSTDYKFKKLLEKRHLYQTEKVSEFLYNREQGLKENVLATRMAGFKQPLYEIIGLKIQSYSVYRDKIDILETKYEGPLAFDALKEYHYKILDTVSIDNRDVYMIHFFPKKEKKKKKLEGVIYIDTKNYGIAKAVFRVKNVLDITSTHFFSYEKEKHLWFPDKKTLKIVKGNNKQDIKILGETIKFDAEGTGKRKRDTEPSDLVYVYSESSNFDKKFDIPVVIKRAGVAIDITSDAINRPESYWNRFRPDTLDDRSMTTYTVMDSIVAQENWEEIIIKGRRVINGYLPVGPFDIDLQKIIRYNNYEGFRVGAGFVTNNKFAETFRLSGYGAYGTKDGIFKYGMGAAVRVGNFSNSWIGVSYADDISEIASTSFATDKKTFKIYDPRLLNLLTFYNYQTYQAYIQTKIIPKSESFWQLSRSRIDPKFSYIYTPEDKSYRLFYLTTLTGAIQWNPFSDYMQTPNGRIETEKRFPKFAFQYTQSIANVLDSDLTFSKLDARAEFEKKYLNGQKTSGLVQAGVALGNTPLTHLYSTSPNNLDKDGILARITFAGKNGFETMYFNEFFSSQYMMGQLKHAFRKFTLSGKFKMAPVLVTRAAWGNMHDKNDHIGVDFKTMEKGYYESGVELNEIFSIVGISAFYRYGPYHLEQFDRNISVKISFVLNLF
ncbi:DUF5686 family protein [Flavobacterium sp. NRK1]|uniref:DUF5686 family protein n=1 Tax=Flavobacterium sp. NRK1 TaxID=2954929 RepID=UPI002093EAE3|nr:DUF5686 family protein [Flavobacterium sp. NRK1]MCO6147986.1 DUF5686 and carboxypeptidase regulatory-like domain-containing protein [Flavobacterium sp. NRK1]